MSTITKPLAATAARQVPARPGQTGRREAAQGKPAVVAESAVAPSAAVSTLPKVPGNLPFGKARSTIIRLRAAMAARGAMVVPAAPLRP